MTEIRARDYPPYPGVDAHVGARACLCVGQGGDRDREVKIASHIND